MCLISHDELIDLTLKLLSIRGESKNERQVADFVIPYCQRLGYQVVEDGAANHTGGNAGNLICKAQHNSSSKDYVLLNAHLDTVVPTHQAIIKIDGAKIFSGNQYPLGLDNRAGVAILLTVLNTISRRKISHRNFYIAFTVCEDSGLEGAPHLKIPPEVQLGFTFDASKRPGNFIASASGSYTFLIEVLGKAAHAGVAPEKGINAIAIAAHALAKIKQGWINDHTTLNIGTINGGEATNIVSECVRLKGEVRSTTKDEIFYHLSELEQIFHQEANLLNGKVNIHKYHAFSPYQHHQSSPVYKRVVAAIKEAGLSPHPIHYTGGSDANVFNEKGLPTINIGIGAQNPHSADEFILLEDLIKSAEIALALVRL